MTSTANIHHIQYASSSAAAVRVSSPATTPNIISDSDESTWTPDEEEVTGVPSVEAAGGFFHSIYRGGHPFGEPFSTQPSAKTMSVALQIKAHANQKMEELGQTHILTSDYDDSSSKESSSYYSNEEDSFSKYLDKKHVVVIPPQRMHQLIFSPDEETLIGTEVIFPNVDSGISDTYHHSSQYANIRIPHLMSSGNGHVDYESDFADVDSPPKKRSMARHKFSPHVMMTPTLLVHPVDDAEEFIFGHGQIHSPASQNKPLDLSLCSVDEDPELALSPPKVNLLVPEMTLSYMEPYLPVVSLNDKNKAANPKTQATTNDCLHSLFTRHQNTQVVVTTSTQTFTFQPSIWYLERKRTRRERFYIGVIISSILVLMALGVIILIQQFY